MRNSACLLVVLSLFALTFFAVQGEADPKWKMTPGMGELPPPATDADFYEGGAPDPAKVKLGKMLFYDKILSGNLNTSCATCHHALTDTGDGLSLPVGEGCRGLGVTRDTGTDEDGIYERVPRNAPPVFNLGAMEFEKMFYDGRAEVAHRFPSGVRSPAGKKLPKDLDSVLAAQAMFPPTSPTEMCGQQGENELAEYCAMGNFKKIWKGLVKRLRAIDEYVDLFKAAFPKEIRKRKDIDFAHAANAIAAFEATAWRADNSPFDRLLRGEKGAMSKAARRGMKLFYGKAGCVGCHQGTFQTDHEFHAVAMPQIGPGKGDGESGHEDFGRERVTRKMEDRYRFRTPSLRNVALTGPWGHAGAYNNLEVVVRHFLDPVHSLSNYDTGQAVLPYREDLNDIDFLVMEDSGLVEEIAAANERENVDLGKKEVAELIEFLQALTDPASIDLRKDVPKRVPSGLPLAE